MDTKQARMLKVGDRVSWQEEIQFTTTAALNASCGTVTKKMQMGYQVTWDDGLVVEYSHVHSDGVHRIKPKAKVA